MFIPNSKLGTISKNYSIKIRNVGFLKDMNKVTI